MNVAAQALHLGLDLLQERGLAVSRVARDDHQPEISAHHRRRQLVVELRPDVGQARDLVEPSRPRVATPCLAVERQQPGDVGVVVLLAGLGR